MKQTVVKEPRETNTLSPLAESVRAVQDAIAIQPDTPATELAVAMLAPEWFGSAEWIDGLAAELLRRYFIKKIRVERGKLDQTNQLLLPGFEGLPQRINVAGKYKLLKDARLKDLQTHLRGLHARFKAKRQIIQLESLLELMTDYTRKFPRITVGEVAVLEQEKL